MKDLRFISAYTGTGTLLAKSSGMETDLKTSIHFKTNAMKNNSKMWAAMLLCLILLMTLSPIVKAQSPSCNYTVINGLSCSIDVQIEYYDVSNCTTPCNIQNSTIPASSSMPFTCNSPCNNLCNIQVIVVNANSVANGSTADISIFNAPPPTPLSNQPAAGGGCLPVGFSAYWNWNYNSCAIVSGP